MSLSTDAVTIICAFAFKDYLHFLWFYFHTLWIKKYLPRNGKNYCVIVDSLEKKNRVFKNSEKENNNLIDPYFAIFPALIKTFSANLASWEKQATKPTTEHFLCYQHTVCRQGHCSCYKKSRLIFRRSMFGNSGFVQMLCNWKEAKKKYHFFHKDESDENATVAQR